MFEFPTTTAARRAIENAHLARGRAFTDLARALFGRRSRG